MVICLEQGADLHMTQRIPLSLTVSCFSKIQIGFTFLVLAYLGSPGQRAVKRVYVCMYVCMYVLMQCLSYIAGMVSWALEMIKVGALLNTPYHTRTHNHLVALCLELSG